MSASATTLSGRIPLVEVIDREDRRRRRRRLLRWALVFGLVPIVGWGTWRVLRPHPVPLEAQFRAEAVSRGDVVREVRASGHVEPVTTVEVGAEISGRLATVEADFDDRVREGQVLARFDRSVLAAQLAQARATVAAARAAVEQARMDRDQTRTSLARAERLASQHILSEAEREAAAAAAALAGQRLRSAEAQLAAQRAALSLTSTNLGHAVIRAPIDGVVITRHVDPGQTVASVLQTPVLFTLAADLEKMEVVAAIDEADIGEVVPGQEATFTVTAYPTRSFHAVVTEVRNAPEVLQNVVTYGAVLAIDNSDLALKPGMTAAVRLRTGAVRGAIRVPNAALGFVPPGRRARTGPGVWTIDDGRLRWLAVRPGLSDGELTEIAPGAIPTGARVLVELTPEGRQIHALVR